MEGTWGGNVNGGSFSRDGGVVSGDEVRERRYICGESPTLQNSKNFPVYEET